MGFQMKVISLPEGTPLNVYGFVRIRGFLFGIPVGILRSGKNGISGRLLTPSIHMGDTSFSLNDLSGLLITGPEGRIYATQWDDIPIYPTILPQTPLFSRSHSLGRLRSQKRLERRKPGRKGQNRNLQTQQKEIRNPKTQ